MEANNETTLDVKTNFFQAIAALKIAGNLNLTIKQLEDGRMIVSTTLNNDRIGDNARKNIIPLNLTATPKELDQEYFKRISTPIKKTSGLLMNMESYLKSLEEANKKSRIEQDKKKKIDKPKIDDSNTKKENMEAYKQNMEKSLQFEKDMQYKEALEALPKVEDYPKHAAEIIKKRTELETKSKLVTMF
ncbi:MULTISPECIES: hypothetical protein [Sphingobacterium]|uniref:hypothetical protein n=1 Tax=Sphingobacterium TaxID=28453 RepID=UPI00258042FB|nr:MULTISPECIES: hypothetical protein [Sphingobacterium]